MGEMSKKIILMFILGITCMNVQAFTWRDLWFTPNQQGQALFNENKPKQAAEVFQSTPWKAAANYRASEYQKAAQEFSAIETPSGNYNRANALALSGKYQEAMNAYNEALKQKPDFADAKYNREIVEKLRLLVLAYFH